MDLYKLKWKLKEVWTPIKNIPANIKMICQWIPILWNNWDWDYHFLLVLMQYKLKRMSKYVKKHNRLVKTDEICIQMNECVEILDRLANSHDYTEAETKAHEEKWGPTIMECLSFTPKETKLLPGLSTEKYSG